MTNIKEIRKQFASKYVAEEFVYSGKTKTVEILGASFVASEPAIFGVPNEDYIERELEWYGSMSLKVQDIPGKVPKIWEAIASTKGEINSNYGYLVFSQDNFEQCENAISELVSNPDSRRASMIYTRPTMHMDFNRDGMSDFICTNCVQYLIRDNKLHVVVQMRSNDAWAGYRNDYAWQKSMQDFVLMEYNHRTGKKLAAGDIHWQVASLHVYAAQFYLLDYYASTGRTHISKAEYKLLPGANER